MDNDGEKTILQLVINGDISQQEAAKRLKVHRSTIGRKIQQLSNGSHASSCSNKFMRTIPKKLKSTRPEFAVKRCKRFSVAN